MSKRVRPQLSVVLAAVFIYLAPCYGLAQSNYVEADHVNPRPINLDFEDGRVGELPTGWSSPTRELGYQAVLTETDVRSGKRCAQLGLIPNASIKGGAFGNLMQAIDATNYRGHVIRFRAAVRVVDGDGSAARLWMRADLADGKNGFFDNMANRPITSDKWTYFEIVGQINDNAAVLNIGMILSGRGSAWIDDVSITDLGKFKSVTEPARGLSGRSLDNVIAFTRLLGYIRHFYPSDEANGANWDAIAVEGMRTIESAADRQALAAKLENIFRPVAPELSVYPTAAKPPDRRFRPTSNDAPSLKLISYRHTGFGQGDPNSPYRTERIETIPSQGRDTNASTDQRRPFRADLGAGVSCVFPLAVYKDQTGTVPHGTYRRDPEKDLLTGYSGNDRATRLADVALIWNVLEHFFPYFDVVNVDWDRQLRISLSRAAGDKDGLAFLTTMRQMIAALKDGHGRVGYSSDPNVYAVPVLFDLVEGKVVVVNALQGKADGLKPGDVVDSINGRPASEVITEIESTVSAATPQWRTFAAMETLRYGAKGSKLLLTVRTGTSPPRNVEIECGPGSNDLSEIRPAKIAEVKPRIFYIDLGRISDDDFKQALPQLVNAQGIVFDLRGYPSVSPMVLTHLTDKPLRSARWMVPIITEPDQKEKIDYNTDGRWDLKPEAPRLSAKIAFLTDGRAISYAESYMGIVEAYQLGSIVGETTAGTNGNVNPVVLPGGYTVVWTGMKVLKHDGSTHHGVGIKPTLRISKTINGLTNGKDEQLDAAISLVEK